MKTQQINVKWEFPMVGERKRPLKIKNLQRLCRGKWCKKRGPQNEGITLWFAENKGAKKQTS
jgi:hypothetical protein